MRSSRIQMALALFTTVVLGITFAPTPVMAKDIFPEEGLDPLIGFAIGPRIEGPPGSMIFLAMTDHGCPPIPAGVAYQDVHAWFIDAAGTVTNFGPVVRTGSNGSWPYSKWVHIPFRTIMADITPPVIGQDATPGTGRVYANCVLSTGVVAQSYWPSAFNVGNNYIGDTSWLFHLATPTVAPGNPVQINSIDNFEHKYKCWYGIEGKIFGHGYEIPFSASSSNGAWSTSLVAAVETEDTMIPLPEGSYTVRVNCKAYYHPGHYEFTYADQLLTVKGVTPPAATCKDVIFIAVPGSGQNYNGPRDISISPEIETAYKGFRKVLESGKKTRLRVLDYPALPVETINSFEGLREYLTGKNAGVRKLRNLVSKVHESCPGQAIVLAGFSQGALVVHEYMVEHARSTNGENRQAITAAITIADPAQIKHSGVFNFGDAPTNAVGICKYNDIRCFKSEKLSDIPQVYQNRTTNVCNKKDVVCDFNRLFNGTFPLPGLDFHKGVAIHNSYAGTWEVDIAGKRAARQVNRR